MHLLLKAIVWAVIVYTLYCGLLFFMQRRMMYPGTFLRPVSEKINTEIDIVRITTEHGKTEAWFLPPEKMGPSPAPAIIIAHGNGEIIDDLPDEFRWLTDQGVALLMVEYPGYGRSEGASSQQSITDTFLAAYDLLVQRAEIDPKKIILLGRSLGGGPVCILAEKRPSAALILISAFTSARAFAANYLAPAFLVRDPYDNVSALANYKNPVLIIHGNKDEIIPYSHGQKLAATAPQGILVTYACGHNDCPPDTAIFRKDILSFLKKAEVTP